MRLAYSHFWASSPNCVHIARCSQSLDYSNGTVDSHMHEFQWCIACKTPSSHYCNHMTDCSVQCASRTRNPRMAADSQWFSGGEA